MYVERTYRAWSGRISMERFRVTIGRSDLEIQCGADLRDLAGELLASGRRSIEEQMAADPDFGPSLRPVKAKGVPHPLVCAMLRAGKAWDVGPMAAVAGAISQYVGDGLAAHSGEVIVENGGDLFLKSASPITVALYAGERSPFTDRLAFVIEAGEGLGVCTSSGVVGPSISFGKADAVVAIGPDCAFADAAATAIANRIKEPADVARVVEEERASGRLDGLIACCEDTLGLFGEIEMVRK